MTTIHFVVLITCFAWVVRSAPATKKPFNWVVVSTFKNESNILSSWIQHYINEGADHFYLIDNGSQDDYMRLLQGFPQQMITLIRDSSLPRSGLQDSLMKKYIKSHVVDEARWILVVDVDEYVYPSDPALCMGGVLDSYPDAVSRIWLPWKVFGSSGHLVQPPEGIVAGFTRRKMFEHKLNQHALGFGKSFTRMRGSVLEMLTHTSGNGDAAIYHSNGTQLFYGDHQADVVLDEASIKQQPLQLNHYMFQSRDYYRRVKCERGGGQSGRVAKYTMAFFDEYEPRANAIEDLGLRERSKMLGNKCQSSYAAAISD